MFTSPRAHVLYTLEEEISRNIGAVMTEGGSPDLTDTDSDSDSVDQIYDIGAMNPIGY